MTDRLPEGVHNLLIIGSSNIRFSIVVLRSLEYQVTEEP